MIISVLNCHHFIILIHHFDCKFFLALLYPFWSCLFQSDSDVVSSIFCGLESIHAALSVMAHNEMPKQMYKEEVCAMFGENMLHICADV